MHEHRCPPEDLVIALHQLLHLAGTDEKAAIDAFHVLIDQHPHCDVEAALSIVTVEYLGAETAAMYARA